MKTLGEKHDVTQRDNLEESKVEHKTLLDGKICWCNPNKASKSIDNALDEMEIQLAEDRETGKLSVGIFILLILKNYFYFRFLF